jgi:ribosomal protein S4
MAKLNSKTFKPLSFKKKINKRRRRSFKKFFFKFDRIVCLKSRWSYSSKNFKTNLLMRNRIHSYFDGVFTNQFFKKALSSQKDSKEVLRFSRIRPEFRLDILLWRLQFFVSPYAARSAILKKKILVNGDVKHFAYIAKEGDLIKLNCNIAFDKNLTVKLSTFSFNSFVEVDLLLKTVIILYGYANVPSISFTNIIRDSFQFQNHTNYLRRV